MQKATIIIRSAGERTVELCKKLILDQGVPSENLFVIREVPFSAAMRKSFETGIEQGHPWTFCVDADVLLRPGSVERMIELAEKQKDTVCEIQGYIMDKFFGGPRMGGVHLYRTALLPQVLSRIPAEGTDIRPEKYVLGRMQEDGYPWLTVPYIAGTHDDEQYNFDIYRKAFVQAVKHVRRSELFITLWREQSAVDSDFLIALRGFADSVDSREELFINREQKLYKEKFESTGFGEKPPLDLNRFSLELIEERIQNWEGSAIYYSYFPDRDGLDNDSLKGWNKVKRSMKQNGLLETANRILSEGFIHIGKRMRRRGHAGRHLGTPRQKKKERPDNVTVVLGSLTGGGTERVASGMIRFWVSQGIHINAITRYGPEKDFYSLPASVHRVHLRDGQYSSNKFTGLYRNIRRIFRLRTEIKKLDTEVILSFLWSNNVITILACWGLGKHVVISERTDPDREKRRWPWNWIYRWIYKYADVITANSQGAIESLKGFVPESRLFYLPNPVDIPVDSAQPDKSTAILNVGRLVPEKNQALLLKALEKTGDKMAGWKVDIVGSGEEKESLLGLIDERRMNEMVTLHGQIRDIGSFYRSSAIFVIPSAYEGTPNALLEAMSYGLPCIVSDSLAGALEHIEDEISGLVFKNGDYNDLADKISRLMSDPELRRRLGLAAKEKVRGLSTEKVVKVWETVLLHG